MKIFPKTMKIYNLFCLVLLVAILIAFFEEGEFGIWGWVGWKKMVEFFFLVDIGISWLFVHKWHVLCLCLTPIPTDCLMKAHDVYLYLQLYRFSILFFSGVGFFFGETFTINELCIKHLLALNFPMSFFLIAWLLDL